MFDIQLFVRSSSVVIVCAALAAVGLSYSGSVNAATVQEAAGTQVRNNVNEDFFSDNQQLILDRQTNAAESEHVNSLDKGAYASFLAQSNGNDSVDINNNNACNYLSDNLRIDFTNDPQEVYRLQAFLKAYDYDQLELTGEFDEQTLAAVKDFQTEHAEDILRPWGYEPDEATGYVYITTRKKINEIYCDQQLSLSAQQKAEISSYREKLNRWRSQGAEFDTPQYLATYYERHGRGGAQDVVLESSEESVDQTAETKADETEQTQDSSEAAATSGEATDTEATSTERGFFDRLFGLNSTDSAADNTDHSTTSQNDAGEQTDSSAGSDSTTTESTSSDEVANNDDGQSTAVATSAAAGATTSVDQVATSVYSGINSIASFFLSPTFLLILLAVLILLLIATLLEDDSDTDVANPDDVTPDVDTDDGAVSASTAETNDEETVKDTSDTETDPFVEYDESMANEADTEKASTQSAEFVTEDVDDEQTET